jgi:hypothetical protein
MTCGDRAQPDVITLVSPANPTRILGERWVDHPDGDLPLFVPPGGQQFFTLIDAAIQRAPGVFMQRYLSIDELLAELTHEERVDLADWLLQVIDSADGEDSVLARWAADLRGPVMIWLTVPRRHTSAPVQHDDALERGR